MKDVNEQEIQLGDKVVFAYQPYQSAGIELKKGEIIHMSPKSVTVEYGKPNMKRVQRVMQPRKIMVTEAHVAVKKNRCPNCGEFMDRVEHTAERPRYDPEGIRDNQLCPHCRSLYGTTKAAFVRIR